MISGEQIAHLRGFLRFRTDAAIVLQLHKDWREVARDDLPETFERLRFIALDIEFEQRDGREMIGGEEVVAANDLDGDGLGRGVVGEAGSEGACALVCASRRGEGGKFVFVSERNGKD